MKKIPSIIYFIVYKETGEKLSRGPYVMHHQAVANCPASCMVQPCELTKLVPFDPKERQ
jgi:hypothetical protein